MSKEEKIRNNLRIPRVLIEIGTLAVKISTIGDPR